MLTKGHLVNDESKQFWNAWNASAREERQGDVSHRQAELVTRWLTGESDLKILDAGCGTGWMCNQLTEFGEVVGTDLADEVVERATWRVPNASFVAGDIMMVELSNDFDVVVSMEVLSHVADQPALLERFRELLRPGGQLMLATQNRTVLERYNRIPPPGPGQLRRWVDRRELRRMVTDAGFHVSEVRTVSPKADHGVMRLVAKLGRLTRTTRVLERLGFGWTIMLLAQS